MLSDRVSMTDGARASVADPGRAPSRGELPEGESDEECADDGAEREDADVRGDRYEQAEQSSDDESLDVEGPAGHPRPEQGLSDEKEHRPADDHRQADAVRRAARLGEQQVIADSNGDDAGHDRDVQVRVGVPSKPARVVARAHGAARLFAERSEVQPP